jgi:hypothetical protein
MESDIYKPPESDLGEEFAAPRDFYVVSPRKFLLLFIATLGLYKLYWFYKQWSLYKQSTHSDLWPIPRALFSIFFTHSLFEKIDTALKGKSIPYTWQPSTLATLYVILVIFENICDRLAFRDVGSPVTDLLSLAVLPFIAWVAYKAQLATNVASGDPEGESNSQLTVANFIWMFIGALLWIIILFGLYHILLDLPE